MSLGDALFPPPGSGLFSRTRWSLVRRAAVEGNAPRGALDELLALYWYPLYAWAQRGGEPPCPLWFCVQIHLD